MDELRTVMPNAGNVRHGESPEQPTPLDRLRARWLEALADDNPAIDDGIYRLINCDVVSVRYALLTQLLGKLTNHNRDALSIQRGDADTAESAGRWDARSCCCVWRL